jgi:hypothetical protein
MPSKQRVNKTVKEGSRKILNEITGLGPPIICSLLDQHQTISGIINYVRSLDNDSDDENGNKKKKNLGFKIERLKSIFTEYF